MYKLSLLVNLFSVKNKNEFFEICEIIQLRVVVNVVIIIQNECRIVSYFIFLNWVPWIQSSRPAMLHLSTVETQG